MGESPFDSSAPGENSASGRQGDDADSKFGEILGKFFGSPPKARPRRRDRISPMDRRNAEHLLRPSPHPEIDPAHTDIRSTGVFAADQTSPPLACALLPGDDLLIAELRVAAAAARSEVVPRGLQTAEYVAPEALDRSDISAAAAPLEGSAVSLHVLRYFFGDEAAVVQGEEDDTNDAIVAVAQVVDDESVPADAVVRAEGAQPMSAERTTFEPARDFMWAGRGDGSTPSRSATPSPEFDGSSSRVRVAASFASLLDSQPGGPARPSDSALLAAEVVSRSSPGEQRSVIDTSVVDLALRLTARLQGERLRGGTLPLIPRDAFGGPQPQIFRADEATPPDPVATVREAADDAVIVGQTVMIDGDDIVDQLFAANRPDVAPTASTADANGAERSRLRAHESTPHNAAAVAAAVREMTADHDAIGSPGPSAAPTAVIDSASVAEQIAAAARAREDAEREARREAQRRNAPTFVDLDMPAELLRARADELANLEPPVRPTPTAVAPVESHASVEAGPVLGSIMKKRRSGPIAALGEAWAPVEKLVPREEPVRRPAPARPARATQPHGARNPTVKVHARPKPGVEALLRAYLSPDDDDT